MLSLVCDAFPLQQQQQLTSSLAVAADVVGPWSTTKSRPKRRIYEEEEEEEEEEEIGEWVGKRENKNKQQTKGIGMDWAQQMRSVLVYTYIQDR